MRILTLVLPLALAGSLLSGCLLAGDEDDPAGAQYVALGDSYTAAPYIGPLDGNDGCFRARNNYPHLVAEAADLELEDVSCSGATSEDVTSDQRTPQGAELDPQIEAIGEDTELVTVRIGGNDFDLIGRVILNCVQLTRASPTGSPCTDIDAGAGDDSAAERIATLEKRLQVVLETIRDRAPDARIIAIGYPQIFPTPEQGGCPELPLATGDLGWAQQVNVGVDAALRGAAEAAGVDFVDVYPRTGDHHICADDPWIAGATVAPGRKGLAYHPYAEEAALVARLVEEELER